MTQYPQLFEWMAHKLGVANLLKDISDRDETIAELRRQLDKATSSISDDLVEVPCYICDTEIFWDGAPEPRCLPYCA